jgi:hypothetical protein
MQRPFIFCAAVLFMLLFSARGAYACSCMESLTVDREFAGSKIVLLLKALSPLMYKGADGRELVSGFRFSVQKVFKGAIEPGQEIDAVSPGGCGAGFKASDLGSEFLIFYRDDDTGLMPICTRSGSAKYRAADISYLENMDRVRGLTRISGIVSQRFGAVVEGEEPRQVLLEGHTVRVTGSGRDVRLKTDANGVYGIYGLPPGQYRVEAGAVNGFKPVNGNLDKAVSIAVTLFHKGHTEADLNFEIVNAVRGRVLSAEGKPVENVLLQLMPAHGKRYRYFVETARSQRDGSFEFDDIPAGTYVIVGNPENNVTAENPYARFYSSGTDNRETAAEITVGPGDVLENFTVKASKPAETVVISGKVIYDDGTPAASEGVKFATGAGGKTLPDDPYDYTDKNGVFSLIVLKGQKGVVYGHLYTDSGKYRACPEKVEIAKTRAVKDENKFLETVRFQVEAATGTTGLEIEFPFSLCGQPK